MHMIVRIQKEIDDNHGDNTDEDQKSFQIYTAFIQNRRVILTIIRK